VQNSKSVVSHLVIW